jgi:O-antigen/teichoic acid export membrane protein
VVPAAIMGVMFPAFSTRLAERDGDVRGVFHRSRRTILALVTPPVVVLIVAARPLLELWLGPEAAANSAPVAAILAAGVLAHAVAQPSFNLLQAAGRPELPARLHLVEAPTYLVYLVWLTDRFGIVGSAVAWTVRVTLSMLVLGWMARRAVLDRAPDAATPEAAR